MPANMLTPTPRSPYHQPGPTASLASTAALWRVLTSQQRSQPEHDLLMDSMRRLSAPRLALAKVQSTGWLLEEHQPASYREVLAKVPGRIQDGPSSAKDGMRQHRLQVDTKYAHVVIAASELEVWKASPMKHNTALSEHGVNVHSKEQ